MSKTVDPKVHNLARLWAKQVPGDRPELFVAQWALESGWGVAEGLGGVLFREYNNLFCIKPSVAKEYQDGEYQGHATYKSPSYCCQDRNRILRLYAKWAKGTDVEGDIIGQLDRWWAPNQGYGAKLRDIMGRLDLGGAAEAPAGEDSAPYEAPGELWRGNPAGTNAPAHVRGGTSWAGVSILLMLVLGGAAFFGGLDLATALNIIVSLF